MFSQKLKGIFILLFFLLIGIFRNEAKAQASPPGSSPQNPINAGVLSPGGLNTYTNTVNDGATGFAPFLNLTESNGLFYKFTLSTSAVVSITNQGTVFATVSALVRASDLQNILTNISRDNDGSGNQIIGIFSYVLDWRTTNLNAIIARTLQPGTYYYFSAGDKINGNITTTISVTPPVTGADMDYPINVQIGGNPLSISGATFSDTKNNSPANDFTNDMGQQSDDIYYKLTLNNPANVNLSNQSNGLQTYLYLLDEGGNTIDYTESQYSQAASLSRSLDAGIYYVVSETSDSSSSGNITTQIYLTSPQVGTPLDNHITTNTMNVSGISPSTNISSLTANEVRQKFMYFDGLGRPLQEVDKQASPKKRDIITPMAYDSYGREAIKYLPYVLDTISVSDGSLKPNAITDQYSFYANPAGGAFGALNIDSTSAPFAKSIYETSPLNRVLEQGFPGATWQPGPSRTTTYGRTVLTSYTSNTSSSGVYKVRLYTAVSIHSDYTRTLTDGGWYGADSLCLTITKDENWVTANGKAGTVEEYKSREGQIIAKRQWLTDSTPLSTYYVYDDLGNLSFVLPPAAKPDSVWTPNQAAFDGFCYQYQYDGRKRLIAKKIPGKGWEYLFYNQLDQLVATQDSVQRMGNPQRVSFTKYDAQGRVTKTGTYNISGAPVGYNARASIQAAYEAQTTLWESPVSTGTGYTNLTIPMSNATVLTVNYYDNYNNIPGLPSRYTNTGFSQMTKGLLTASYVSVLNNPADVLWTVNYYDDLGRITKAYKQHYLGGTGTAYSFDNCDIIYNIYDFSNNIDTTSRWHFTKANTSIPAIIAGNTFNYDHMGRKWRTGERIYVNAAGQTPVYLSQIDYNELGQVTAKHYHGDHGDSNGQVVYLGESFYKYNERGWVNSIMRNSGRYGETINYNSGPNPQYNGNISQFIYNGLYMDTLKGLPTTTNKIINYTYDKLNRLLNSQSTLGSYTSVSLLDETVAYDAMGNITSLARTGPYSGTFTYKYKASSNQLDTVKKSSAAFKNYAYDGNGNTTSDSTTKILTYNLLNLPLVYKKGATTLVTYYYDAEGNKLRSESKADSTWEYINGIVYHNGTINFIQTEEGKAMPATAAYPNHDGAYDYVYELKDYLGNVRASYDNGGPGTTARVIQENDYYPFGLTAKYFDASNGNRYLYNGKELQVDLANQYDYGARFYDPMVARWTSVDPLAEEMRRWSPYNYGFDNSIRFEDPDGMGPDDDLGLGGRIVATLAFDFKHAVFNTVNRLVGSPYRERYKSVDGQEQFESEIYKEGAPKTFKQAGVQLIGAAADALAVIPEGGSIGKLAAKNATEATIGREAADVLVANKAAGASGENFLNNQFGGESQAGFNTKQGRRVVDNLTPEGVAQESKVGRTSLTKTVKKQISKDVELVNTPGNRVNSAQWNFFPGVSGSGPTKPLQKALQGAGIPFINY